MNKTNWIILIGGILLLLIIILSFISYIPTTRTINIYSSAWKNAQLQAAFIDKIEYSIDSEGYGVFKIYIGDKLDYMDCIWNIQWMPDHIADYLKEQKNERK